MDGVLKKQLKKLDNGYNYENSIKLAPYSRNSSPKASPTCSEELTSKTVRFTLNEKEEHQKTHRGNFLSRWIRQLRHDRHPKSGYSAMNAVEWERVRLQRHCGHHNPYGCWARRIANRIGHRAHSLKLVLSDWIFLAVLGVTVSCVSALCDSSVFYLNETRQWLKTLDHSTTPNIILSAIAWCSFAVGAVAASATFVHYISPQAIGSGIPEMKTIIRGVILKDYLTFRTLVSKVIGLIFALGSGMPIGKMGPFVHIASVVANQLSLLAARIDPAFGSETRRMDALTAACAVGVASTFSSPVGGVLFSIEVTTMYFSVRNYWRGFFAACCGAIAIRLLKGSLVASEVTITAFYQTNFNRNAFTTDELPFFVVLGIICGMLGALYIYAYKCLVLFLRQNTVMKKVFQRHWIVYPLVLSFIVASVTYPHGFGKYITGRLRFPTNLKDFFTNCTFTVEPDDPLACADSHTHSYRVFEHWVGGLDDMHSITLLLMFIVYLFVCSLFCITLPIPSGIFMPIFVLGAAIGRFTGEIIANAFPLGLAQGIRIAPGVYAVAGSASFSAAVTHTVSVSVIVFEATGQLHCILPVLIAVIVSNAVCTYITPSFFDTIIKIKHLPFLPDIPPSNSIVHILCAENIMVQPVKFITRLTTYAEIRRLLVEEEQLRIFPVVDAEGSQMLIGTISRHALLSILENYLGDAARKAEAETRVRKAIETIDEHFKQSQSQTMLSRSGSDAALFDRRRQSFYVPNEEFYDPLSDWEVNNPVSLAEEERGESSEEEREETIGPLTPRDKKEEPTPRKISRFLVVPSNSPRKIIDPPESSPKQSPGRRNSQILRRNAMFAASPSKTEERRASTSSLVSRTSDKMHLTLQSIGHDYQHLVKSYIKHAKRALRMMNLSGTKKESRDENPYDLTPEEREEWEQCRLLDAFEMDDEWIDAAPFQLVKKTSLFKIHSIFSMMQLSKAYVTDCGRLIGVVALSDVRHALECSQGEIAAEMPQGSATVDPETGGVPSIQTEMRRKDTDLSINDILTPTLEIVRSSAVCSDAGGQTDQELAKELRRSSLRRQSLAPPRLAEHLFDPPRGSGDPRGGAEELVEAVAYLRRKSLAATDRL